MEAGTNGQRLQQLFDTQYWIKMCSNGSALGCMCAAWPRDDVDHRAFSVL